jgi:hypothetical protein
LFFNQTRQGLVDFGYDTFDIRDFLGEILRYEVLARVACGLSTHDLSLAAFLNDLDWSLERHDFLLYALVTP